MAEAPHLGGVEGEERRQRARGQLWRILFLGSLVLPRRQQQKTESILKGRLMHWSVRSYVCFLRRQHRGSMGEELEWRGRPAKRL